MKVRDTREYAEFDRQRTTQPKDGGVTQEIATGRLYPKRENPLGFFGASLTHTYQGRGDNRIRTETHVSLDTSVMYMVQPNRAWPLEIAMPNGVAIEMEIASEDGEIIVGDAEAAVIALYRLAQQKSEQIRTSTL